MSSRHEAAATPGSGSDREADAPRDTGPEPEKVVTVLSVSGAEADHLALGHVFRHTKWTLLEAHGCSDAIAMLSRRRVSVVICDCTLPDGYWKDVLEQTNSVPDPPLIIVASRLADDRLWADVMDAGGYDVLEKPFNHSELVRVVSLAWRAWKDQCRSSGRTRAAGD